MVWHDIEAGTAVTTESEHDLRRQLADAVRRAEAAESESLALLRSHSHALIALEEMGVEARREAEEIVGSGRHQVDEVLAEAHRSTELLLVEAQREADRIVSEARLSSDEILDSARRDAEELRAVATLATQHPVASARAEEATTQVALAVAELQAQIGRERAGIDAVTERLSTRVAMVAATLAELISPSLVAPSPEPMRAAPGAPVVRWSVGPSGLGATPVIDEPGAMVAVSAVVAPTPVTSTAAVAESDSDLMEIGLPLPRRRPHDPLPFGAGNLPSSNGCAVDADDANLDAKFTEFFEHDGREPSRAWILGE
jgi:cell division septum initiation protein DivIVA